MTTTLAERNELFIGGSWHEPAAAIKHPAICPADETLLCTVPTASSVDVDIAVSAAQKAYENATWSAVPIEERAEILNRALTCCRESLDAIAVTSALELGQPLTQTRRRIEGAFGVFADAIASAEGLPPDVWQPDRASNKSALIQRRPAGVVAAITPFNGPFIMSISKIVRALMAGCSVVAKPALEGSLQTFYLAEALAAAGLPEGVVSILPGGPDAGRHLVEHPGVDLVSFTGSTDAGRRIAETCGANLKRTILELGGKSAAILLEDADPAKAIPWLTAGAFGNAGQVCAALTRVLAPRKLYGEVVDGLASAARDFKAGHPLDTATTLGALITSRQFDRVSELVNAGIAEGAQLAAGGGRPSGIDKGWFFAPTVLFNVDNGMRVAREEIFGPVVVVIPYEDEPEAISIANDSPFGLHGAVFSEDEDRAIGVAERIRTGTCAINGFGVLVSAPFGGVKSSGWGREGGPESILEYTEVKTLIANGNRSGRRES